MFIECFPYHLILIVCLFSVPVFVISFSTLLLYVSVLIYIFFRLTQKSKVIFSSNLFTNFVHRILELLFIDANVWKSAQHDPRSPKVKDKLVNKIPEKVIFPTLRVSARLSDKHIIFETYLNVYSQYHLHSPDAWIDKLSIVYDRIGYSEDPVMWILCTDL